MWHFFIKGGLVMIPLGFCSILAMAIVIERIIFYSLQNKNDEREFNLLKLYLHQGKLVEAKDLATSWRSPMGRISGEVLTQSELDRNLLEQSAQRAGEAELKGMQRGLGLLDTIVTASPLLGLFGTVTGIIQAFTAMASTGGNQAAQLSDGIAKALYTTAFGLAIAIPALFFVNYFYSIVDRKARELTAMGQEILTILRKG